MSYQPIVSTPELGKVYLPEVSVSYPGGGKCMPEYTGCVAVVQKRLVGVSKGAFTVPDHDDYAEAIAPLVGEFAPELFKTETVMASVSHNQRTTSGSAIQAHRQFGLTGTTSNGVFTIVALASTLTAAANHVSINTTAANNTASEVTVSGLTRSAAGAVATTQATALDGTFTGTLIHTWTSGGNATANGGAILDSTSYANFNLYAEATFATATMISSDQIQLTWTITN